MRDGWRRQSDGPRWLYAEPGRLRAGWRLLAFTGALLLAQGIADSFIAPLFGVLSGVVGEPLAAFPWVMLVGVLGAVAVALRLVDDAPWESLGTGGGAWRLRHLATGAALGTGAIMATVALLGIGGFLQVVEAPQLLGGERGGAWFGAWAATAVRLLLLLAPAALWEELVFRGYLWRVAEDAGGRTVALWSTSVAFGLVHLTNPGAAVLPILLVVLAGVCLGVLRARTASLPAAWAAHLAWNWIMGAVLHVPVSGLPVAAPGYRVAISGPVWLTGGAWGPEGGAIAALVLGGALVAALRFDHNAQRVQA